MSESAIVRALSSCDEDEEENGEVRVVEREGATVSSGEPKRGTVERKRKKDRSQRTMGRERG